MAGYDINKGPQLSSSVGGLVACTLGPRNTRRGDSKLWRPKGARALPLPTFRPQPRLSPLLHVDRSSASYIAAGRQYDRANGFRSTIHSGVRLLPDLRGTAYSRTARDPAARCPCRTPRHRKTRLWSQRTGLRAKGRG